MEDKNQLLSVKKTLSEAKSIVVVIPPDPSVDLISAALGLHFAFITTGKSAQTGCASQIDPTINLKGLSEVRDSIGNRNLIISFDYHEDDLEKVDYDIHPDGKFYLMIKPKANSPVPDVSKVHYSYSGADADVVIALGINAFEELGKIYAEEKKFLDSAHVISLNVSPRPPQFTTHFYHAQHTSFSELVSVLLEHMGLKPTTDAATNLISTIYSETKDLTSAKTTADTFSSVAFLMRCGARPPHQTQHLSKFSQPTFFEPPRPVSQEEETIPLPIEEDYPDAQAVNPNIQPPVPNDWTKPKIFRATDL